MKTYLTLLALLSVMVDVCDAQCQDRTTSTIFCESDFVIKAKYKSKSVFVENLILQYKVKVLEVFRAQKGFDKKVTTLRAIHPQIPAVGVNLKPRKVYLLSGNLVNSGWLMTACQLNLIQKWRSVKPDLKSLITSQECPAP